MNNSPIDQILLDAAVIRSLPVPSPEQQQRFVNHLRFVHSWYRHIPLFEPVTFVVFLAPQAGRWYASEHPRLPFGNSMEEYQQAFGLLDYMWKSYGHWDRDGGEPMKLPVEFPEGCYFKLFPYVYPGDDDCFLGTANQTLILSGAAHPDVRNYNLFVA